jgi:hypothetical protein
VLPKLAIILLLTIVIGALGYSQLDDGVFSFLPKSDAQGIIEESQSIEEAMVFYSLKNDGVVDIGDPEVCPDGVGAVINGDCAEGQHVLHFIKEQELLKGYVGKGGIDGTDPFRYNPEDMTVERVVADEKSCKEINKIRQGIPLTEELPTCGTPEGDAVFCCSEEA